MHPSSNWPQRTFKRSRGSGPRAGNRRLHWPAPRHHGSSPCAATATRSPRTCICAALPGALWEAGLSRVRGFTFRNQVPCGRSLFSLQTQYFPKVRSVGFPSVLSSPERQAGAPRFLIDLVGNHFRPGVWNTRGPWAANNRKGTSGVCCLGAGLVGQRDDVSGASFSPHPPFGGRDVGAQRSGDGGLS